MSGKSYRVGIVTASDKGYRGARTDESGPAVRRIIEGHGYALASYRVLPDDRDLIAAELRRLADEEDCDLVLTAGGTGFSPRDVTPEATLSVIEREAPGIPEAIRAFSMGVTKRAMLSRARAGIRGKTLIVNLPGSPKAAEESLSFIIGELSHGLAILRGDDGECARLESAGVEP